MIQNNVAELDLFQQVNRVLQGASLAPQSLKPSPNQRNQKAGDSIRTDAVLWDNDLAV